MYDYNNINSFYFLKDKIELFKELEIDEKVVILVGTTIPSKSEELLNENK